MSSDPILLLRDEEKQSWQNFSQPSTQKEKELLRQYCRELLIAFNNEENKLRETSGIERDNMPEPERKEQLTRLIQEIKTIPVTVRDTIVDRILDGMYRSGPLTPLYRNPAVTDIQVFVPHDSNFPQIIQYMERGERKVWEETGFADYDEARDWINTRLSSLNIKFDPAKVSVNGYLPSGDRIHVISGPAAYSMLDSNGIYRIVRCMIISIRRFDSRLTLDEMTESSPAMDHPPDLDRIVRLKNMRWKKKPRYFLHTTGMFDQASAAYLKIMIEMGKNYVASGGTGVGKTTLANALTPFIPETHILIVLEEAPEMQPQRKSRLFGKRYSNVIRIYEREGVFTLENALKESLRMMPDRIFVAELRDAIAYVYLKAIRSGHDGSGTTIHASSCKDAIKQIIENAASHPSRPSRDQIRNDIYTRIHTITHAVRVGSRRYFTGIIQLLPDGSEHTVMEYINAGRDEHGNPIGYFCFYGPTDEFVQEMLLRGYEIPKSWGWEEDTGEESAAS